MRGALPDLATLPRALSPYTAWEGEEGGGEETTRPRERGWKWGLGQNLVQPGQCGLH